MTQSETNGYPTFSQWEAELRSQGFTPDIAPKLYADEVRSCIRATEELRRISAKNITKRNHDLALAKLSQAIMQPTATAA